LITAGIDIGHESVHVVLLEEKQVLRQASFIISGEVGAAARTAFETILDQQGMDLKQVDRLFATGVGREKVAFADGHPTEMLCQVVGAHWYFPKARTVIDLGAEGSRILRCDAGGNLTNFLLNDKCASGAGVFLETVADMLNLSVDEIGPASLRSLKKVELTTTCAVFAESEIVAEIHRGTAREDILAGVHESIVAKVIGNSHRIGVEPEVVLTGGVAKNLGIIETFRLNFKLDVKVPEFPETTGALGAAILARNPGGRHK
jgi:(R)-2-hydroxyacyl-CoA dehydratese activating ATPase